MTDETPKVVKLRWDDVEDLPTVFANFLAVSHASGDEFYLIFGEASPPSPLLRGEQPEVVPIRPVAKIALSPGAMMRAARAIQQNAADWQRKTEELQGSDDEASN